MFAVKKYENIGEVSLCFSYVFLCFTLGGTLVVAGEALRTNGQDTLLWEKSGQQLQPLQGLWNQ